MLFASRIQKEQADSFKLFNYNNGHLIYYVTAVEWTPIAICVFARLSISVFDFLQIAFFPARHRMLVAVFPILSVQRSAEGRSQHQQSHCKQSENLESHCVCTQKVYVRKCV